MTHRWCCFTRSEVRLTSPVAPAIPHHIPHDVHRLCLPAGRNALRRRLLHLDGRQSPIGRFFSVHVVRTPLAIHAVSQDKDECRSRLFMYSASMALLSERGPSMISALLLTGDEHGVWVNERIASRRFALLHAPIQLFLKESGFRRASLHNPPRRQRPHQAVAMGSRFRYT